ncbi:TauD/TfdA dioxygenase family protein [Bradyrhizobium sp. USDA 4461]
MSERDTSNSVIPGTEVIKRSARVGAEIRNIRLSSDLPDQAIAAIKNLLLEHKVIFFRDQGHFDDVEQERFARRFGKPALHPEMIPTEGTIAVLDIDSARRNIQTDVWHVDWSCLDAYPKISVLRGVVIPPVGGDTVWSNTAAAYLDLPRPLQRLADALWAVHSLTLVARRTEADNDMGGEDLTRARFETEHPVVRIHPQTGERTLVLGSYVARFVDVPKYDCQKLLELFESHVTAPENTVRWNWKQGDIVIWDNRATMHYAVDDYGKQRRIVRRAAVEGEIPVSVDGRCSVPRVKIIKQPSVSLSK